MGVGLYLVKEIVTLHGGAIDVSSTEGIGTTFTIRLPRSGGATQDVPETEVSAKP
jgi:signal transduction histidine kinase